LLAEIAARKSQFKEARGLFETCGRLARFTTPDIAGRAFERLGEIQELAGNKKEAQNSFLLAYYYLKSGSAELKARVHGLDASEKKLKKLVSENEYQASYFQEQGRGLLSQGKTEEALRFLQAAHLLAPQEGMALIQLGEAMEKTASSYEDFRRIMSYYQRAIDRDPKEAMGYIRLGLLETEQYNFDRAYKLLKQALALAPDSDRVFVALGKHFYKREDYNEALNYFLKAAKINPSDSEILYYAGKLRIVYKKDDARDAQRFFSQAYTLDPKNYDALVEWLKLKVVNYEKHFAIKFVNGLIANEPQNPSLYWVLGEVYSENKEHRRAISYYHKSLDFDNRQSKVRMSLAKALEAVGELDKAVAEFRLASLLDRRNSEGFYHAADLLFQMKGYTQAEEVLKFLLSVTPGYPGVHRYLSKIQQLRDQKDAALEEMKQEVAANPQNYKYVLELAELFLQYEKWDEAVAELKKVTLLPATSQAPEFKAEKIRAYLLLSRAYRAQSQADNAEGAIRLALSMDPNDPELHRELGYVYYSLQRDKEGVREFEYYLQRNPAAQDAVSIRGLIKKMEIEE
jgi:tetratricopeptide (TPR) repeat protein